MTATDEETEKAFEFINKHFYIVDSGLQDLSIEGFYTAVEEIEQDYFIRDRWLLHRSFHRD
jgi:hypothetical protein